MSNLFISHSHHDNAAAHALRDWLVERGFVVFLDFHPDDGIAAGRVWEAELRRQLRRSDAVLALCSARYAESRWCFAEVMYAKALDKAIIPLRLDDTEPHELLRQLQVLDFRGDGQLPAEAYLRLQAALRAHGIHARAAGHWTGQRPPYPGLAAFEEVDSPVFFGREDAVRETLDRLRRLRTLQEARCLFILGASGCGKSSLLRAGVMPKLRSDAQAWLLADVFRPGERPFTRFAQALAQSFRGYHQDRDWKALRSTLLAGTHEALVELGEDLRASAGSPEARVLVSVDQMEELLVHARSDAAAEPASEASLFLQLLRRLADMPASPYLVIGTLRSDFLGQLQNHGALAGLQFDNLTLGPLSAAGFRPVIEGPAKLAGIELEAGLSDLMIEDTETSDALPLLAFTLRELYEKHGQDQLLEVNEYREPPPNGLGGLKGAVAQAAEGVLKTQGAPLTDRQLTSLRNAFLGLVGLTERGEPARRRARWSELPAEAHPLLEQFVQARLLVSREVDGQRELEVAHEALFRSWQRLGTWLEDNQRFLLWRKELDRHVIKWAAPAAPETTAPSAKLALLVGGDLATAKSHLERYRELLNGTEQAFIDASVAAERRRVWRTRAFIGAVMAVLLSFALIAFQQRQRATERAAAAKNASLLAAARSFDQDPTLHGVLLREIRDIKPDDGFRSSMSFTSTIFHGHKDAILCTAFNHDGSRFVTGSQDKTARVWNTNGSGEPVVLAGHEDAITVVAFSPDGRRVLTGSKDRTARIWNADGSGEPIVLAGHTDPITAAAFSPDGTRALTAAARSPLYKLMDLGDLGGPPDNTARLWTTQGATPPRVLAGHSAGVTAAAFSPDGRRVVTASIDGTARIWSVDGSAEPVVLDGQGGELTKVAFSPDATLVVTGSQRGAVQVWGSDPAKPVKTWEGHTGAITAIVFAPDGKHLVTGSEDATALVWNMSVEGPVILNGHTQTVTGLALSPDGEQVVTVSADGTGHLWSVTGRASQLLADVVRGIFKSGGTALFAETGRFLGTATDVDQRIDEAFFQLRGHRGGISGVAWSPNGRDVLTVAVDSTARLWRPNAPREPVVLKRPPGEWNWLAFSPDGERVLQLNGKTAELRNADGSGQAMVLGGHTGDIRSAAFSRDGNSVITGSDDQTARIWGVDGASGPIERAVLKHDDAAVSSVVFHPDGTRVATVSGGQLTLWNVDGTQPNKLAGIGHFRSAAFTPDGKHLVGLESDSIDVWNADGSGKPRRMRMQPPFQGMYDAFRLTADSKGVVICAHDATLSGEQVYLRADIDGGEDDPFVALTGYSYDLVGGLIHSSPALQHPTQPPIPLWNEGLSTGDPCGDAFSASSSTNRRRSAISFVVPMGEHQGQSLDVVVTRDVGTLLWRQIDYCLPVRDRKQLLAESDPDAERAFRCCQDTLKLCRTATFGECAQAVAERYKDVLSPCGG